MSPLTLHCFFSMGENISILPNCIKPGGAKSSDLSISKKQRTDGSIWRLPICLINQPESKKATVCNRHQTRNRKIQSEQIMNARGMPGIMQVECIPRLWPVPGLGLKLWSLGLGLCAGPGPRARAWAQARARGPGPAQRPRPRLQSFSPRPGTGQSLGMHSTCMIPGMPRAFIICSLWIFLFRV